LWVHAAQVNRLSSLGLKNMVTPAVTSHRSIRTCRRCGKKIAKPDLLIYLSVSFPISTARRKLDWQKKDYDEQLRRLDHARQHANLFIDTDHLTPQQVLQTVLDYLKDID
jgi:hypothetical protein